jgi:hypothetical protein
MQRRQALVSHTAHGFFNGFSHALIAPTGGHPAMQAAL